jgi:hypothetical protein
VNRDAVRAELPASVVTWLDAHASDGTRESIARDLAYLIGSRLLYNEGEGGFTNAATLRANLRRAPLAGDGPSPGVAAILDRLPLGNRKWSAQQVARAVCDYLGIPGANALQRVIKTPLGIQQQERLVPVATT